MTTRLRLLAATVPTLVAVLMVVGAECTSATHAALHHLGLVHADPGCASGTALGPSFLQLAGLALLISFGVLANSVAVQEAAGAYLRQLFGATEPLVLPDPVPVTTGYIRPDCWQGPDSVGSRDPPLS